MMFYKKEYIFENIKKLQTPVGFFEIESAGEKTAFSVKKNIVNMPVEITDENSRKKGKIAAKTNYSIIIDAAKLQLNKDYSINFKSDHECVWKFCDSDEHTTCYNSIINGWFVGIGANDPNDETKTQQSLNYSEENAFFGGHVIKEPPEYDETAFTAYTVDVLELFNGYRFKLFDYSISQIHFEVAWLKKGKFADIEYENALGMWLC